MHVKPLTSAAFWENRHEASSHDYTWPRPDRYFLDCELHRAFRRHLPLVRGGALLEVGCGSSVWLPCFARQYDMRVVGIDFSPTGLLRARHNVLAHGVRASFVLGDAFQALGKARGTFDCIFSLGVVEHFENPQVVVAAWAEWLAPGGLLITWAPNLAGYVVRLSRRLDPAVAAFYGPLTLEDLITSQRRAGLKVLEARYAQFADLTLVSLRLLPPWSRRWVSRAFRLASLPLVTLGHRWNVFFTSRRWCAGVLTVSRRELQ